MKSRLSKRGRSWNARRRPLDFRLLRRFGKDTHGGVSRRRRAGSDKAGETDTSTVTLVSNRPRCQATDAQGRRCGEPVLWDEATARPVSTRCEAHGGGADAALIGRQPADSTEVPKSVRSETGAPGVLANSPEALRLKKLGRSLGCLPALALAGALCVSAPGPAFANFESAIAAYEGGAYREAEKEFEALAAAGDERAEPFLEKIRQKLADEGRTEGSVGSSWERWSPFDQSSEPAPPPESDAVAPKRSWWRFKWSPFEQSSESPVSDVVAPKSRSIWSTIFHLPGDATVIGLQYIADFLKADHLRKELHALSRHGNKIALGILAGFWWLVIIRGMVGICIGIGRFMKAATTIEEKEKRYG